MRGTNYWSSLVLISLLSACGGSDNIRVEGGAKASRINVELGIIYLQEGKYKISMDRLKKAALQDPSNAEAFGSLGLLNVRIGRYDQAEIDFKKAIKLAPKNPSIRNNYGVFLCKQKRYKESHEQFLYAINDPLYSTPENAYLNAGTCGADKIQAEKYFRAALRKNSKFSPALLSMAKLSLELKRYLSARAYLQRFHQVKKSTAASLWLSVQVEKVLGDNDLMYSRALLLKRKYPDSEETRQYHQWNK